MGFAVFVFVGLIWLPSGGLDRPVVVTELTRAACEAGRADFVASLLAANAANPYPLRMSWSAPPCELRFNASEAGGA